MRTAAITAALLLLGACVEKGETPAPDDSYIKENLLATAPAPQHPVNADLGGKVVYLGCDLDRQSAAIGDRVQITHYWKVIEPPGAEWRLFTHVNGTTGHEWINVDDTKMRKGYGPERWKAGDIIRDQQVFPILKSWKSPEAVVYVGMFRKGGQSEHDRMAVRSGPSDGHGRVEVVHIPIISAAAAAPAASQPAGPAPYVVRRASGKITVDGKGDEKDWALAQSTGPFRLARGGDPVPGSASARLLWDDKNLYILVDVTDPDVATQYRKHDEPIWKEDAIEVFIDADRNGSGYVELQVNPRNATFDAWYPTVRPRSDVRWDSGIVTAVTVDGTLDDRGDSDKGWHAEMAIPLAAVKGRDAKMDVRLPPRPGDRWNLDIVRVDKPKDKGLTASAWAAIGISDFHALDKLVTVTFGDEKGDVPK